MPGPGSRLAGGMSLKPYLKLYLLVVAAVFAVVVLCYGLVQGLNSVRYQAYLENLPRPLLSWLAVHPRVVLGLATERQPGQWRLVTEQQLDLEPVERERLSYGQILAHERAGSVRWHYHLGEGTILQLSVRAAYRDLAEIQAGLLARLIEQGALAFDPVTLRAFGYRLGVLAETVTGIDQIPDQAVLDDLGDRDFAYYQADHDQPAQVFVRLGSDSGNAGEILKVTMPAPFEPWGWPILLLIATIAGSAVAILVHQLLSRLHQHLRNIENVVARIARGELDARVRAGNLSLFDRLGEAFNRMAEHIQRLVGVQREMIHAVSHELRTPVARIRFGVQMLEDSDDPESWSKRLAGIDGDIQELDELIDEILTYARLEQGGPLLAFQDVNVAQIIDQVVEEQRLTCPQLTIEAELHGDADRWAMSDAEPRYLHRAVQNLVGNATRYAQGRVKVTCHFDPVTCRVDVEDDGPGIPEADWDKVFTAFARLDDSRTRKSGGYGLGLSIVRRILYWHGGQAFVGRSESLGGARFSLVWPRRQPEPAPGDLD